MYSHADHDGDPPRPTDETADRERPGAPVSADLATTAEADRRPGAGTAPSDRPRIRVAVIGATGYVGAELVRLLDRHPAVEIVGPRRPGARGRAGRADPPAPGRDAAPRRRRDPRRGRHLPRPARTGSPRSSSRDRGERRHGHRPGSGLPAPRPRRLSALVRVRAPPPRASRGRGLRASRVPSARPRQAGRCVGPDRRRAGLLSDGHPPRPRAARLDRAHRRPRRRRQERRLGRRSRPEGGAPLRRGQRERPGLRPRRPPPRRRDRAGAGRPDRRRRAARGLQPGSERGRLPAPPHPDEPGHPRDLPRPARPARSTRPTSTRSTRPPTPSEPFVDVVGRAHRRPATSTAATSPGSTSGTSRDPGGSSRSG